MQTGMHLTGNHQDKMSLTELKDLLSMILTANVKEETMWKALDTIAAVSKAPENINISVSDCSIVGDTMQGKRPKHNAG